MESLEWERVLGEKLPCKCVCVCVCVRAHAYVYVCMYVYHKVFLSIMDTVPVIPASCHVSHCKSSILPQAIVFFFFFGEAAVKIYITSTYFWIIKWYFFKCHSVCLQSDPIRKHTKQDGLKFQGGSGEMQSWKVRVDGGHQRQTVL